MGGGTLTVWTAVPLQHEVDGVHGPGRGVVAEAPGWRLSTRRLEQLREGPEDLSLGTRRLGQGCPSGSPRGVCCPSPSPQRARVTSSSILFPQAWPKPPLPTPAPNPGTTCLPPASSPGSPCTTVCRALPRSPGDVEASLHLHWSPCCPLRFATPGTGRAVAAGCPKGALRSPRSPSTPHRPFPDLGGRRQTCTWPTQRPWPLSFAQDSPGRSSRGTLGTASQIQG